MGHLSLFRRGCHFHHPQYFVIPELVPELLINFLCIVIPTTDDEINSKFNGNH